MLASLELGPQSWYRFLQIICVQDLDINMTFTVRHLLASCSFRL